MSVPGVPPLAKDGVHLWRLDLSGGLPADCESVLDEGERLRAQRFAFDRDRNRFVRARCALRSILGAYLGIAPRALVIASGPNGKPRLDSAPGLEFNLSHSGDHGLVAVAWTARVGVDIEELRSPGDPRRLAERLFTAEEQQSLRSVGELLVARTFLTCWTRKEAFLKALGAGLTIDASTVHVGTLPQRSRIPIPGRTFEDSMEVTSLEVLDGCVAALAVEGGHAVAGVFDWNCRARGSCRDVQVAGPGPKS